MAQFDAVAWFQLLTLGGLAGAMGQAIRVIVGIKKLNDQASNANLSLAAMIVPSQLVVSLLIGFVAGALASSQLISDLAHISSQQIFALSAAGYAGADFIEGFMTRVTPATAASAPVPPVAALPASADGAVG
ncbi:hypothetical protein [Sphingomonas sp. 22176]|uniref:hypothetical protein n=1 Tax=Sphingomonas sp. 22176 TaxID=3453884 RepID=UPI003F847F3C